MTYLAGLRHIIKSVNIYRFTEEYGCVDFYEESIDWVKDLGK
jgi:hypothetical protein